MQAKDYLPQNHDLLQLFKHVYDNIYVIWLQNGTYVSLTHPHPPLPIQIISPAS